MANISNEEFAQQFNFQKQAWKVVPKESRAAWKAFFVQFVSEWTAHPEFASARASGGYLLCAAGSIQLNTTVLLGCGMACVACTTECATETQKCVTRGHMGTRNSKMLLTTGFRLCNMCSNYHVGDVLVDSPVEDTVFIHIPIHCEEVGRGAHLWL